MKLTFLGAAGEVTGSCFLVEGPGLRFLVDCGMFQGGREADAKNAQPFAFDPRALDFVLITHAHIDHSGLLPRLAAEGFRGPIYATEATADLLEVMLLDAAHIQEKEAEWRERGRRRREAAAPPLYTVIEAQACLAQLKPVAYDAEVAPHPSVRCRFRDAGHILGSAIVEARVTAGGHTRRLVFSGDLGQPGRPIVRDPTPVTEADVLVVESTYGNRLHKPLNETLDEFVAALDETIVKRRGNVVIPAFAVGRTQDLLYLLADLHRSHRLPPVQVYVDSPMATKATAITIRHADILDAPTRAQLDWLRTNPAQPRFSFVQDVEESMALDRVRHGAVIIAASGMCDGGRIRHHLAANLPRPESSIVFTGFQAQGTLGRRIVDGAREVRIFGEDIPVRARVHTIGGLSAHADQAALLGWLRKFRAPPRQTFVVHGEAATADLFAQTVREQLGWGATVPARGATITLA